MNLMLLIIFALLHFIQQGYCLRCYTCYSSKSAEDCFTNKATTGCYDNEVCFSSVRNYYGIRIHWKGCVDQNRCDAARLCGSHRNDETCKFKCCGEFDHCNKSFTMKSEAFLVSIVVSFVIMIFI